MEWIWIDFHKRNIMDKLTQGFIQCNHIALNVPIAVVVLLAFAFALLGSAISIERLLANTQNTLRVFNPHISFNTENPGQNDWLLQPTILSEYPWENRQIQMEYHGNL